MTGWQRRAGAALIWLAPVPVVLAWLCWAYRESPMAVLIDVAVAGVGLGVLGLALAGTGLRLVRRIPGKRWAPGAAVAVGAAALLVMALLSAFRFLPYSAEEVRFANGDVVLAGTLYRPRGAGPHPGAVLIHGSGPETRREYAFYARYLARRGVAALAYDKRGAGASTGQLYGTDYGGYADDAAAAVRLLAGWPTVDPGAVGLIGFSEAEWVAPLVAARAAAVAFVAVIGASGVSPAEQVAAEMAQRLRARGHADSIIREVLELNEQVYAYQRGGAGAEALRATLAEARTRPWFDDAADLPDEVYAVDQYAWWRSVMDFDAAAAWARVRVPVLLLKGGRDDRSSADTMRERIGAALRGAGNERLTVRVFPAADHLLLEWPRGERTPPPVFADGYPGVLVEWLLDQTGGGS